MTISKQRSRVAGFTLIELVLVMALLTILLAIAAPNLGRSLRDRKLDEEAKRFLATTEYCRSEAISQAIPMIVWIDPASGHFGVREKDGYLPVHDRSREFTLNADVHFDMSAAGNSSKELIAAEMGPDGLLDNSSIDSVRLVDRYNTTVTVAKTQDAQGFEIATGNQ